MRVAITGGTGLVGQAIVNKLLSEEHHVFILTRKKKKSNQKGLSYIQWLNGENDPTSELKHVDVFINLAGESINSGRWTDERKARIKQSRIESTSEVIRILSQLERKPFVFINASAIGFYGMSETKTFTERDTRAGTDFLATTVKEWELVASQVESQGIRTVFTRFGIILDREDGALPRIAMPYQFFAGGTVGTGRQWLSWIHLDDVVTAILHVIDANELKGPVNFCAPDPVTMKEFGQTLATVLHRPHWIPAPGFALKLALGEMSMLVLDGQKVIPEKLLESGFEFSYPSLRDALENIYR